MSSLSKNRILRIYLSSTDKFGNEPLYETLVFQAKEKGMTGATVIKGVMGFGASSAVTSTRFWSVSEKLPIIIEIVDEEEKLKNFFAGIQPILEKVKKGIMVSMEETTILYFKTGGK